MHVRRLFAAQDYLRDRDDEALLDASLAPAEDHVVELAVRSGSVVSAQVSLTGGLGLSMPLDQAGVDLLEQLAPGRTLREAAGEGAVPLVRALVERGFVRTCQLANVPRQRRMTRYCAKTIAAVTPNITSEAAAA